MLEIRGTAAKMAAVLIFSLFLVLGLTAFTICRTRQVMATAGEIAVPVEASPELKETAESPIRSPTPTPKPQPKPETEGLSSVWPSEIQALESYIEKAAAANRLDPNLLAAIIKRESWFSQDWCPQNRDLWGKPGTNKHRRCAAAWRSCPDGPSTSSCTGGSGEIGPAQVMPSHFGPGENPRDLATNISKSAEILRQYLNRKNGDIRLGLAAYNCGPNRREYPPKCWAYANKVLEFYQASR